MECEYRGCTKPGRAIPVAWYHNDSGYVVLCPEHEKEMGLTLLQGTSDKRLPEVVK